MAHIQIGECLHSFAIYIFSFPFSIVIVVGVFVDNEESSVCLFRSLFLYIESVYILKAK